MTPLTINFESTSSPSSSQRRPIWIIIGSVMAFFAWSANAPLDEIVRGAGRVVPSLKTQVVQNLEGGIVQEIFVTEGQIIEAGQSVAQMDETQFQSAYQELIDQRLALLLKIERLSAESSEVNELKQSPTLVEQAPAYGAAEMTLFSARRQLLVASIALSKEMAILRRREVEMLRPMVKTGAIPELDLVRAEQVAIEAEGLTASIRFEFETKRAQEYSEALTRLRQVDEQILAREDQLARTLVRTPVKGIVNRISATTIGGVLRPGDPIAEILPLDKALRIEGRVSPRDIGFVFVGMPATVKLTAFDFSIYGTLAGSVVHVGADTVTEPSDRQAEPYYEVFIELTEHSLLGPNGRVDIRPGMLAEIELKSGQKTVLSYLLKPLFKTTEAFTER